MAQLITLSHDGDMGPAGTQVWVEDDYKEPAPKPAKKTAAKPDDE